MVIAGEPSGDELAAQLVTALQAHRASLNLPPAHFFGAGGPLLKAAGADISVDLTQHAVIGLWEVIRRYSTFRRVFHQLLDLAGAEQPDLFVGVDFGGFNLRFAVALRERARRIAQGLPFSLPVPEPTSDPALPVSQALWNPRIVQFVSPQVWASRAGRAQVLDATHDLLLSILPFEPDWYAQYAPRLPVRFVGHPLVDRHAAAHPTANQSNDTSSVAPVTQTDANHVVLLPGSRRGELERHLPLVIETASIMRGARPDLRFTLVLPSPEIATWASSRLEPYPWITSRIGGLSETLTTAALALACTGTVTLECAWHRVPTLAYYKTSWLTYEVGRRLVRVPFLAMPNLLAGRDIIPEFIQHAAHPENLSRTALEWLGNPTRLNVARDDLAEVATRLGPPGAAARAAVHVHELLEGDQPGESAIGG